MPSFLTRASLLRPISVLYRPTTSLFPTPYHWNIRAMSSQAPIQSLQAAWKKIAPLELADNSWDNVGVMIEAPYPKMDGKTVLLTIDLTTEVCEEALSLPDCSLIVSYHPPIFSGLKKITLANTLQASLLKLSAKGISVFAPHTSLDAIEGGINTFLSRPFADNLESSTSIQPKELPSGLEEFHGAGMGRLLTLKENMDLGDIVSKVKGLLGLKYVQVAKPSGGPKSIKTVAICAGSGGSLFKGVQADLYFTGEMSHHEVLAFAQTGKTVILCNHSNTERPYLQAVLKEKLETTLNSQGDQWSVAVSTNDRDPLEVM